MTEHDVADGGRDDVLATGLADAAAAWGALLALVCAVELVVPRLSPLPLLWCSTAPSAVVAIVLFPSALALVLLRRSSSSPRCIRWSRRCAVVGVAACLLDALLVMAGGSWNTAGAPYRASWYVFLPASLPPTLFLAVLWAYVLRRSRTASSPALHEVRRVARVVRGFARGGMVVLAFAFLAVNVVVFNASLRDPEAVPGLIAVFGAGVLPDGQPSDALRDRVLTAVKLAERYPAAMVLMTGGVSGGVSEPRTMRDVAVAAGLDLRRIVLDESGENTAASVRGIAFLLEAEGRKGEATTLVSHGHHLARIRLLCRRAGLRCDAVAARQRCPLAQEPYFIFRDAVALAYYGWVHG